MQYLALLPLAFFFFLLQITAPGLTLVRWGLKSSRTAVLLLIGTCLSLVLQASAIFFLGYLIGTAAFWVSWVWLLLGIPSWKLLVITLWRSGKQLLSLPKGLGFFALLCVLSLSSTLFLSWIPNADGLAIQAGQLHDSSWHVALSKHLLEDLPPVHPSLMDQKLKHYHYFYDLIIAGLSWQTRIPVELWYFQVFSVTTSALLAGMTLMVARALSTKTFASYWLLAFTFFTGSLGFLIPLFFPDQVGTESSFWVSQTFAMLINPQLVHSLAVMLGVIWLLLQEPLRSTLSQRWQWHVAVIILIAGTIGFKSYGWLVMSALYGVWVLQKVWQTKNWSWLLAGVGLVVVSLPYLGLVSGFGQGAFFWFPLWYLSSLFEAQDRMYYPQIRQLEELYWQQGNWLRYLDIRLRELAIFLLGNLGARSVLFLVAVTAWHKKWQWPPLILPLSAAFALSAVFPLLFLQRGAVWNSIQFWYYTLILANIFATWWIIAVSKLFRWSWLTKSTFTIFLLFFCLPTYVQNQWLKLTQFYRLSAPQLALLQTVPAHSRVFVCPGDADLFNTALVSAVTGSKVWFANPEQLSLVNVDPEPYFKKMEAMREDHPYPQLQALIAEQQLDWFVCVKSGWHGTLTSQENVELVNQVGNWILFKVKK